MTLSSFRFSCKKHATLLTLAVCFCFALNSQNNDHWIELWQTPGTNFYTIQNAFDSAWADREIEMREERQRNSLNPQSRERHERENEKLDGTYFKYRRWEYFMEPRVYPSGDINLVTQTYKNFNDYLNSNPAAMAQQNASIARTAASNAWTFIGPTGAPSGGGAGRLCCVRFEPGNSNHIYVGTPAGGLWKSLDAGLTWNCLTDFLPAIGCSDVAIDPANTNILYMASGDNDAGDSPSIGVLKSTDGGLTWNPTGLTFNTNSFRRIGKLLMDPTNSAILYAATSVGIYKTYDSGVNWYRVSQSNTTDMEFKPGDPNTIYACRVGFYKSTNGGVTWTQIATGLPQSSGLARIAIAVTPAAPNNVYLVTAAAGTYASEGVYLSFDSGNSFQTQSTFPNLLGWSTSGSDSDGQGWYDLAIAVSPFNENQVIVGGVNVWRSDDAGGNWSLNAHWYGGGGAPYVHADIHDIVFSPTVGNTYFIGCDGGIFKTNDDGNTFSDLSNNLCIAQIYRGGVSGSTHGTIITGHQDNGTNVKTGTNYLSTLGGDGMDCFIDRTNDNNMFGSIYYGDFHRSTDGGNNWSNATSGTPGDGDWITPWEQDPVQANVLYSGFDKLYKSTNQGASWFPLGTTTFGTLKDLEVAPSNTQYIYVSNGSSISRSTDGGINWTSIIGSLSGYSITRIAVSDYDENKVWVSVSGYNQDAKVFFSSNAGTTWTNISYGLPNLPANCIRVVPGTSCDAIFVGMDAGVYYHDNSSTTWQPFFTSLPNAPVYDLDIYLPTMMLTAFTYGRGVWEAEIDQSLFTPLADFSATPAAICPGQTVQFTDLSTFNPTSWSWSFPGGTPSSSTAQNPSVVYNAPGIYPVTLVASNAAGSGTTTQPTFISVSGAQQPPYVEGFVAATALPSGWSGINAGNQNYFWQRSASVGHNSTESEYFDNFNNIVNSDQDEIRSMGIDFTGYTSLTMTFDVAYARYNASRSDTLEVLVSTDCGASWTSVYLKGGATLATVPNQTSAFVPTNSQWRNETVNISAYAGQGDVLFAFRNHGRHGNFLYVDNININAVVNAAPVAAFTNYSTVCENNSVTFTDLSAPAATSWSWTFPGGNPSTSTAQNPSVIFASVGTYTISLVASNGFGNDSTSQIITVNSAPIPNAGVDTSFCSTTYVQLNASGGVTYNWMPSAGLSNTQIASPGVYMTSSNTFSVTVTDINGCSALDSVDITILPLPNFSVSGTPLNICVGDTVALFCSNPAWAYSWSPASSLNIASGDSVLANPASTTTYSVISVDTNGCNYTINKTVTVYPLLPQPTVLVWGWYLTCSTPALTYQWFLNGTPIAGATSQTYLAATVGNYSVEAYSNTCSSGISNVAFVDGIKEEASFSFTLAPNPSNGIFDLSFSNSQIADFRISIFSVDGKLVYLEELKRFSGAYKKQINLSDFGSGMYVIRLSDDKQQSVQHIIIY